MSTAWRDELRLTSAGQLELLRGFIDRGAALRTTVLGTSMAPFVREGDVVTIAPVGRCLPRVGDIAAAAMHDPERLVVHRIVRRVPDGVVLRGDALPAEDGVTAVADVLGRVVRVERGGRTVRFGVAAGPSGGALVAALSRAGVLSVVASARRALRLRLGSALRRVQGSDRYRSFVREHAVWAAIGRVRPASGPQAARDRANGITGWEARVAGRQVGSVQFAVRPQPDDPWAGHWLSSLRVKAPLRGLGAGEALIRAVIAWARREGAPALLLAVHEDNARAVALYRKMGFTRVSLPALEPLLAEEQRRVGRRRVTMRLDLEGCG